MNLTFVSGLALLQIKYIHCSSKLSATFHLFYLPQNVPEGSCLALQHVISLDSFILYSTTYTIAFKSRSPASSWPLLKLLVLYFMVGFAASKSTKMAQVFFQQV